MIDWRDDDGVFLPMINDTGRNRFYKSALELKAPGKTVIDIGAGTGFMSILAMRAGAKNVIAVEQDPERFELAKNIIHECGLSNEVELVLGNWLDQDIKGDIYVSETIDSMLWNEDILDISEHAIRNGGEFIPGSFEYWFQVYHNFPLFSMCMSESEAFEFQPDIDIDPVFENIVNQKAQDTDNLYRSNLIFNLFQAIHKLEECDPMKPVRDCLELIHETEHFVVDLNTHNHNKFSQFQHKINLKDLPKSHGYCILLTWRAHSGPVVMDHWDTIFGTPCKIVNGDASMVDISFDSLRKTWYFTYG